MSKSSFLSLCGRPSMRLAAVAVAAASLMFVGCADDSVDESSASSNESGEHGHDHDGHDHGHGDEHGPETLSEAVEAVAGIDATIKTAMAANDKDAAHGPLHKIGNVLNAAKKLVETADMTDEQRESSKKAVQTLFDSFSAIDATMHGQEGKSYDEVSADIAESLKTLKSVTGMASDEAAHDHDDHDHAEGEHDDHDHAEGEHKEDEKTDE